MDDAPRQWSRDNFTVSTDRTRLDLDAALALLHTTFWARSLGKDTLARAVTDSLLFALYRDDHLVGFARAVTDRTTYAYLTDVVVADALRRHGLGEWLMQCVLAHPDLQGLRRIALLTRDARTLYQRCGFVEGPPQDGHVYMERRRDR